MKCTKKRLCPESGGYNEKAAPQGRPWQIGNINAYWPRASASIFDSAPVSRMNQQTSKVQAMMAVVYQ